MWTTSGLAQLHKCLVPMDCPLHAEVSRDPSPWRADSPAVIHGKRCLEEKRDLMMRNWDKRDKFLSSRHSWDDERDRRERGIVLCSQGCKCWHNQASRRKWFYHRDPLRSYTVFPWQAGRECLGSLELFWEYWEKWLGTKVESKFSLPV